MTHIAKCFSSGKNTISKYSKIIVSLFFIIIMLGFSFDSNKQNFKDGVLEIAGWVLSDQDEPIRRANVTIFKEGEIVNEKQTGRRGSFNFELPVGYEYTAVFSHEGYASKKINFNGNLPDDFSGFNIFYFEFIVELFPYVHGVDYSLLETPFVEIAYIGDKEEFFFDEETSRPKITQVRQLKEYTYRVIEFKDDYDELIVVADRYFDQSEFENALEYYNKALELLPAEHYPEQQIQNLMAIIEPEEILVDEDLAMLEAMDEPERIDADIIEENPEQTTALIEKQPDLKQPGKEDVSEFIFDQKIFSYFDFASYYLDEEYVVMADKAILYLIENSEVNLVLYGHSDNRGNPIFNFFLSQLRAQAAYNYCVSKGVSPDRLLTMAHGQNKPVMTNALRETDHKLNRRVDFEFFDKERFDELLSSTHKRTFRYLNNLQAEANFSPDVELMVQFIAAKNPIGLSYFHRILRGYSETNIIYYYDTDMLHRYLVGSYQNVEEASNAAAKLKNLGYDTYIVAFNNGDRISLEEVR